jgi:hypothetical protein
MLIEMEEKEFLEGRVVVTMGEIPKKKWKGDYLVMRLSYATVFW